jgi:hypothetical protein
VTPHHKPARLGPGGVEVVGADAIDRPPVEHVLDRALHRAHKREEAEREQGREHHQGEYVEGVADGGHLGDEAERDQRAGNGPHVERGPRRALADRGGARALQREVLGGEHGEQRLAVDLGHSGVFDAPWTDPAGVGSRAWADTR